MAVKNIYKQLYIMQISNLLLMNNFSFRLYINIPENYIAYKVFLAKSWKSLFFQDLEVFQVFRVLWQPWCCNSGYGVTLQKALVSSKSVHLSVKISWHTFNCLHPKNIWLVQYVERFQCIGMFHINIDYVRNICKNLLLISGKDAAFLSNDSLVAKAVCDTKSLKCILGQCAQCKSYSKIHHLEIQNFKCSRVSKQRKCYYQAHKVKVRQCERQEYFCKDEEEQLLCLTNISRWKNWLHDWGVNWCVFSVIVLMFNIPLKCMTIYFQISMNIQL